MKFNRLQNLKLLLEICVCVCVYHNNTQEIFFYICESIVGDIFAISQCLSISIIDIYVYV